MRIFSLVLAVLISLYFEKECNCIYYNFPKSFKSVYILRKVKGIDKMAEKIEDIKEALLNMGTRNIVRTSNNNAYLSLDNYFYKPKDNRNHTKLINSNVLSIFSYALKYMNKKSFDKWLKSNIKAPFYDTYIPRNKPLAYIRFKTPTELKTFEKLIENKRIYPNDNLSIIKINKNSKFCQKRKFDQTDKDNSNEATNNDANKEGKKEDSLELIKKNHENMKNNNDTNQKRQKIIESQLNCDKTEKEKEDKSTALLDLQTIMKLNKKEKVKSIENYVTPLYKYKYEDQIKIKNTFLKKCKDQILNNLRNKWMRQNLIFGELDLNIPTENESDMNKTNNGTQENDEYNDMQTFNDYSLEERVNKYNFQIDNPLYPPEKNINGYRNKCEFTISYDENNNVEIGFVVGKVKTNMNETNDENNCNFSENNISNNPSPVNESHQTKLRNKKQKQCYFLNPIVKSIDDCIHIHSCMKEVVKEMKSIIKDSNYPVFDRVYKTGIWRLLVIRLNSKKELMITVQTYSLDQKKKRDIKRLLINRLTKKKDESFMEFSGFKVVSLYLQEHGNSNDSTDQSQNEHLWGVEHLEETILGNKFLITPSCFFQVNHTSCEILYKKVIDYVNINKNMKNYIFDLCCGTGTISICIANALKHEDTHIVGIDICEESIISANKNAQINKIKNYKFIKGRVEELFAGEIKNISQQNCNIIVIVDPPRSGLAQSVLNTLSSIHPINQIIYVSCNPSTLINNVTNLLFMNECFKIKNLVFVDMFPHTYHLECITNIERTK
ncbi:RNA (uracil-5-)methyltransferase, putative [Plasmodium chabaudi chabaudi]|uniref:RNA (Uracil-5-)methyltransferase, putative n=1 Tax=Plasmodium chabaudi chabaudi TaxID=31271 RepID=A0A4V0K891_PLACU|nr:RNA (uracil-5-)methyltransferase, putative [Plasmodium chabaudi chabaudi]VTZ68924.1 RNA (uracil-5-)methyltransferase, putative [Plasmodium chabaudi chabaudi]|eukprot:XP_746166.2 RNA (uracil-5-)methyltransferase, putative [Plasmodium chabaudi chabaudi]